MLKFLQGQKLLACFLGAFSVPSYHTEGTAVSAFYLFYTEKLCGSAPRDAERVKGQTNIPFCIEFQGLSNGHVNFIAATHCVTVVPPESFAENLKNSNFFLLFY